MLRSALARSTFLAGALIASPALAATYADIDAGGNVTNSVLWDGQTPYQLQPGHSLVLGQACVGQAYSGGTFVGTCLTVPLVAAITYATTDQLAAVAAATPVPCGTIPFADTLNGSVGSGSCFNRPSDTRPTVVQSAKVMTDASGNWSVTWAKAFATAAPFVYAGPVNTAQTQPYICNVVASSTTGASGKCWAVNSFTLPAVVIGAAAMVINPASSLPGSIPVLVVGRDLTQ